MLMKNAIVGGELMAHVPRKQKIKAGGVCGVGTNNAGYCVQLSDENGRGVWICPYYQRWRGMLKRCYSERFQESNPTYKGCTVCAEWLLFSTFREWMTKQDWEGKELDKDIIGLDRQYSHASCRFIDHGLNSLLNDSAAARGDYPCGVTLHKQKNRYQAKIRVHGKFKHIGWFSTIAEASAAYTRAKRQYILEYVRNETDQALKNGLLRHYVNLTAYEG